MANKSLLGDTRVSPTLIQTSEARDSSSLILWECVIISAIIGAAFGSFWTVGLLVYIGQRWNCLLRVAEHTGRNSYKAFTSWNYLPIDGNIERKELERMLIQRYRPKHNKI